MDDFVCNKLTEWGLSKWIDRFKDEEIDEDSFYCLDDHDVNRLITKIGPQAKFKKRLKLLKGERNTTRKINVSVQCKQEHEEETKVSEVSTSTGVKGKRKSGIQDKSGKWESPTKRKCEAPPQSDAERMRLSDVKNIMGCVLARLDTEDNTKLNTFLKTKIKDLETDKRELVGVFGKNGAGKSSLINAIIGERDLLPTGNKNACTTVMIKVEANMHNSKYEADIEFITKEEWEEELWSLYQLRGDNANQGKEDDDYDSYGFDEKLSALYGEEYKNKTSEELMDKKYFKEIPEFLCSSRKTFTCQSAKELSEELVKYTGSKSENREGEEVKKMYWPLVKRVTVRVPMNEFLQHVTLVTVSVFKKVHKRRDQMWKEIIGKCSTVWIVTDITQAASEAEPWEILENASSLMENGGKCQQIHFICTKSDQTGDTRHFTAAEVDGRILERNKRAKKAVMNIFNKQNMITKHFGEGCFKVFTVSSSEFPKGERLKQNESEIPKLQDFLQNINDCHSLNYVTGAYGILSLIQGARCKEGTESKTEVCANLEESTSRQLDQVKKTFEEAYRAFEKCLSEGVEKSKSSCDSDLHSLLHPYTDGRSFLMTLKCVVQNKGIYKSEWMNSSINLNMKLSSHLTDSIDEEFMKTFPNDRECEPFNGVISKFSLNTGELIQKYKDVELQLIFLQTEEEEIKTKLKKVIWDYKKKIYDSLTETIEENMLECYETAAKFEGNEKLNKMRNAIASHVRDPQNVMFEDAKDVMLNKLNKLKECVLMKLETTMKESIELSLKTNDCSIPDVSSELAKVKKIYSDLKAHKKQSS